jgi:hypothetical protein
MGVTNGALGIIFTYQWVFSVVLLGLTSARIHYTENLSPDDPLNGGVHFYDPIIAELLVTSILVILWSMFASVFCLQVFLNVARTNPILSVHAIYMRCDRLVIHTFAVEAIALSMLFVMWLVGTAIATVSNFLWVFLPHILMQKAAVHVGQPGLVPSVFPVPSPFCTRGNCVDWLGLSVIPTGCQPYSYIRQPSMDTANTWASLSP